MALQSVRRILVGLGGDADDTLGDETAFLTAELSTDSVEMRAFRTLQDRQRRAGFRDRRC